MHALINQVYDVEVFRFSYADVEDDVRAVLHDVAADVYAVEGGAVQVRSQPHDHPQHRLLHPPSFSTAYTVI